MKQLIEQIKTKMEKLNCFVIRGNSFFYLVENVCVEIFIEKSRFNAPGQEAFWLSMRGFAIPNPPLKSFAQKRLFSDCYLMFTERISVLWKNSFEQYMISSQDDIRVVLSDVERLISNFLIPFCERVKSIDDLIHFLTLVDMKNNRNKYSMGIATTLAKMGEIERSKPFFLNAEGDKAIIEKIAKNYGVE